MAAVVAVVAVVTGSAAAVCLLVIAPLGPGVVPAGAVVVSVAVFLVSFVY